MTATPPARRRERGARLVSEEVGARVGVVSEEVGPGVVRGQVGPGVVRFDGSLRTSCRRSEAVSFSSFSRSLRAFSCSLFTYLPSTRHTRGSAARHSCCGPAQLLRPGTAAAARHSCCGPAQLLRWQALQCIRTNGAFTERHSKRRSRSPHNSRPPSSSLKSQVKSSQVMSSVLLIVRFKALGRAHVLLHLDHPPRVLRLLHGRLRLERAVLHLPYTAGATSVLIGDQGW
jgi:hypothetical protein